MSDALVSPPYPGDVAAVVLFEQLVELRRWVLVAREDLNARLGQEYIPDVRSFAKSRPVYLTLSVPIQMGHIQMMRQLRKEWDHLLCLYEDVWDAAPACIQQRAFLVNQASVFLQGALLSQEAREARQQRGMEQMGRAFQRLQQIFQELAEGTFKHEEEDEAGGDDSAPPYPGKG